MVEETVTQKNEKADIVLLSGFLGAGKTTLLKRILSWETDLSDTVVIVNEFGEVGIDGALLEKAASGIVEMVSGCICCTLKAELNMQLRSIWEEIKPRKIFIEATGVADTDSVLEALNDDKIREHMTVDKIVTVVDADYWEAREHLGPLFFNQIKDANLILLNKIDLVGEEKIPGMLTEIHETFPSCQVIPTRHCAVDPETLWSIHTQNNNCDISNDFYHNGHGVDHNSDRPQPHDMHENKHEEGHDHHEHGHSHGDACSRHIHADEEGYVAFSFLMENPINETCFKQFVDNLPWELFRMKGPVRFEDRTELINFVGGRCEFAQWEGMDETRLAFVGLRVHEDDILQSLKNCVI